MNIKVFIRFTVAIAASLMAVMTVTVCVADDLPIAAEKNPLNIERSLKIRTPPSEAVVAQKIFVEFSDSPKLTTLFREQLSARGYEMAASQDVADAKFIFRGNVIVDGGGQAPMKESLGVLTEKAATLNPSSPDYHHQNVFLPVIAASSVVMGKISATDILSWLGQTTGAAGRFNEAITGDPKGWCLNDACREARKVFSSRVMITASGSGQWYVLNTARSNKVVADYMVADAITSVLEPLLSLQRNTETKANAKTENSK
jgi:hypothetical protein